MYCTWAAAEIPISLSENGRSLAPNRRVGITLRLEEAGELAAGGSKLKGHEVDFLAPFSPKSILSK